MYVYLMNIMGISWLKMLQLILETVVQQIVQHCVVHLLNFLCALAKEVVSCIHRQGSCRCCRARDAAVPSHTDSRYQRPSSSALPSSGQIGLRPKRGLDTSRVVKR